LLTGLDADFLFLCHFIHGIIFSITNVKLKTGVLNLTNELDKINQ